MKDNFILIRYDGAGDSGKKWKNIKSRKHENRKETIIIKWNAVIYENTFLWFHQCLCDFATSSWKIIIKFSGRIKVEVLGVRYQ